MSYQKLLLTGYLCALVIALQAADPTAQLASANAAYQQNDFAGAIQQYEALLQKGYHSEALYYNLGNSYYRTNNLGKAVLNYERALLLDPNDTDIQHNLSLVRDRLPDEIDALPTFFLARWWNGLSGWLSAQYWSIMTIGLVWLSVAGLTLWLLGSARRYKKIGFIAGLSLLVLSLLTFALAGSRNQTIANSNRAVVQAKEIVLRSAPDEASKAVFTLHAGTTIQLLDQIGKWHKVVLQNGEQGWLPDASFEQI
ncbi:MAG: tetratricopeptide repeat protein [Saprospiraceae bacterium]